MKDDFHSAPIILDGVCSADELTPSSVEIRDYIVAMIAELSELADDNGEPLIGAMLAEVSRRCQA